MNANFSRRKFLGAAALSIGFPTIIPGSALGKNGAVAPSNRIVMGGIGIGPRGREVLKCFLEQPDVQFVAIADVQETRRETVRRMANRQYGNEDCYKCSDMFEIFDRKDIDVVQITTGDHWHTLATILAAKAGKDMYTEKPCSMTICETQELADTVNLYQRVFQAGTQRRNVPHFRFAGELARGGKLGKIHTVHASIIKLVPDLAWLPEEPMPDPKLIDWERWLGPSPWRPYNKRYVEGRWRGHYDFHGAAGVPEWGAHTIDLCQFAADADGTVPVEYEPKGDEIHCRYANGVRLILRLAGFSGEGKWEVPGTCPVRFEGDDGWVETADFGKIAASSPSLLEGAPPAEIMGTNPINHVRDFLDCVKSRKKPAANEVVTRSGHIACHAAAIAWQLGRKVRFDPASETFLDDEQANRMCSRARREPWHA